MTRLVLGLDTESRKLWAFAQGADRHEVGRRGTPMGDVLHAVDLDRRPVALHGGELAARDAPQQTGAVQVVQRARWMTSKTGPEHPNCT